jgi:hypothetical protein
VYYKNKYVQSDIYVAVGEGVYDVNGGGGENMFLNCGYKRVCLSSSR